MEHWWEDNDMVTQRTKRKTCPRVTLSTQIHTDWLGNYLVWRLTTSATAWILLLN
jgi:hypothetical protein